MSQREKQIPAAAQVRLVEALDRIVQLYEATDQADNAAKWRKTLETAKAKIKDAKQK